ncbi:GntR family transcriptional regulator [Aureimonas fodinaquatilis]|uniref:GntR family transcriptional regulator n=1 Tax=Aureimonas fodinaquatilis TaxID=2565783 RepID=A0A5B0E300_9HYPH|nr:GntR family transcriptional regulator [Aureimonas fodinaquatilis]KAA0972515.1 GntR family transcriptional regulator [Aureimonas fodinaquatilis]
MRIKRETVSEQCIQLLRDDIFDRKLLPGDVVTEEALARDMGVSRATVREVLNTLMLEGLLTRNTSTRSLYVTRLGSEKISEIYRARRLLEIGGVAAFALREDSALQPLVEATNKLIVAIEAKDHREIVRHDINCHIAIVGLIDSADLVEFYKGLLAKLQLAMADVTRSHKYDLQALRSDHLKLVELLRRRRINDAKDLVADRITRAEIQMRATAADRTDP